MEGLGKLGEALRQLAPPFGPRLLPPADSAQWEIGDEGFGVSGVCGLGSGVF